MEGWELRFGCGAGGMRVCSDREKPPRRKGTVACFGKTRKVSLGPIPKDDLSFTYVPNCIRWKGLLNIFYFFKNDSF